MHKQHWVVHKIIHRLLYLSVFLLLFYPITRFTPSHNFIIVDAVIAIIITIIVYGVTKRWQDSVDWMIYDDKFRRADNRLHSAKHMLNAVKEITTHIEIISNSNDKKFEKSETEDAATSLTVAISTFHDIYIKTELYSRDGNMQQYMIQLEMIKLSIDKKDTNITNIEPITNSIIDFLSEMICVNNSEFKYADEKLRKLESVYGKLYKPQ